MKVIDYDSLAVEYAKLGIADTFYLAFRDIPDILAKYFVRGKALDFGCGTGRSTRFLKSLNFDVLGVDINHNMLEQAKGLDHSGSYLHIRKGNFPFRNASFDLIFSSFVFIEISSKKEIKNTLVGMRRILKTDGIIVIVTSSENSHMGNWLSFSYDFKENKKKIRSGGQIKILIKNIDVVINDYYWTEKDFKDLFSCAGLKVLDIFKPLGKKDDPYDWIDEGAIPPVTIYILSKNDE